MRAFFPVTRWVQRTIIILLLGLLSGCADKADDASSLDSTGNWTFVNYWAKWCKPCIKEIPELNELHQLDGVRVLGVNYDGAQGAELQAQLESLKVQFPTLGTDPAARYGLDRPQVLPTTLVINPDGALTAVLVGPQTMESLLTVAGLSRNHSYDEQHDEQKDEPQNRP
ncbi:MAG: TlpA family protein disulfide reductase [Congregibacter sp.]|nr:TlpA family protein disulfide reductase [Congregibacter sp.]